MQPVHSTGGGRVELFKQCWLGAVLCGLSPFYPCAPSYTSTLYPSFLVLLLLFYFSPLFSTRQLAALSSLQWPGLEGKAAIEEGNWSCFLKGPPWEALVGPCELKANARAPCPRFGAIRGWELTFVLARQCFSPDPNEGFVFFKKGYRQGFMLRRPFCVHIKHVKNMNQIDICQPLLSTTDQRTSNWRQMRISLTVE